MAGGLAGALLCVTGYLATRLYLQAQLGRGATGLLQYDSYYPLAFARELHREHHWLLFHNPFGSLDHSARLVDGAGTVARLTLPLWDHHLLLFDVVSGAALSVIAGWWFSRLAFRLSRHSGETTLILLAFVFWGTGIAYLVRTVQDGGLGGLTAPLLWASDWGPSWSTDNLASWALLYHALYWGGLWAAVSGRRRAPVLVAAALAFVHPFTAATYALTMALVAGVARAARTPAIPAPGLRGARDAALVAGGSLLFWAFVLPAFSRDATFIRHAYLTGKFVIGQTELLLFLVPAALVAAVSFAVRDRDSAIWRTHAPWLVAAALPLMAAGLGYRLLPFIPQPAHWTRVYPVALLVLAALALRPRSGSRAPLVVACCVAVLGVFDSAIANFDIGSNAAARTAPIVLDPAEQALIGALDRLPARAVVYIRSCGRIVGAPPTLEYAIASLTDQRPPFGHDYFSPGLARRLRALQACHGVPRVPPNAYVIADSDVAPRIHRAGARQRFGRFVLVGVKRAV